MTEYTYKPLPPGKFIRYLILEPGQDTNIDELPLRCSLRITSLDEAPPFEALSYVWGNSDKSHQIMCDNGIIPITANLHDALRRVRLPDRARNMWADSICIFQSNSKEQAHQVALMGDIYGMAANTIIYLGPDPGDDAGNVVTMVADVTCMLRDTILSLKLEEMNSFPYPQADESPGSNLVDYPRWGSFRRLIERPWFTRGWVVQEAALSATADVLWGAHSFKWVDLLSTACWCITRARGQGWPKAVWQWVLQMPNLHLQSLRLHDPKLYSLLGRGVHFPNSPQGAKFLPLDVLMEQARELKFTQERDRIYSMLNLAHKTGGVAPDMQPDYEADLLDIYREFSREYFVVTKSLDLLSIVHADASYFSNNSRQLESWVPRWDGYNFLALSHGRTKVITDGTGQVPSGPVEVLPGSILKVRGVVIDEVWRTSTVFEKDMKDDELFDIFASFWNECLEIEGSLAYDSRPDLLVTLARTLARGFYYGKTVDIWISHVAAFLVEVLRRGKARAGPADVVQLEERAKNGEVSVFIAHTRQAIRLRCLVVTRRGYFGLTSGLAGEGDAVAVLYGAKLPYTLRRGEKGAGWFRSLGECCVPARKTVADDYCRLGDEGYKDWLEWDVRDQDILIR